MSTTPRVTSHATSDQHWYDSDRHLHASSNELEGSSIEYLQSLTSHLILVRECEDGMVESINHSLIEPLDGGLVSFCFRKDATAGHGKDQPMQLTC